jgi:leucyl aminopeptidase (aminopeptidase T)
MSLSSNSGGHDGQVMSAVTRRVVEEYLGVKRGEKFVVVTDDQTSPDLADALMLAAWEIGNDATNIVIRSRQQSGQEPPDVVREAMVCADVCLCAASRSLYHTQAKGAAQASGTRGAFNAPHLASAWTKGAMTADFLEIRAVGIRLAERLRRAEMVRVTSPAGTDMTVYTGGREPKAWLSGVCRNPGEVSAYPAGEVSFPPIEGQSHGRIVVERIMTDIGKLAEPIVLTIEAGECVGIEGGEEADRLRALVDSVPGARNLAELGIGTNQMAVIGELITESKKAYGTAHFALGDNAGGYGGVVECPLHLDGLNIDVTIEVDGETIMSNGALKSW